MTPLWHLLDSFVVSSRCQMQVALMRIQGIQFVLMLVCEPLLLNMHNNYYANLFIVSIQLTGIPGTPIAGQNFSLTCIVSGAHVALYDWVKNGGDFPLNESGSTLNFTLLKLSDAGQYTCIVNGSFNSSHNVIIQSEVTYTVVMK